jgi:dTDP-4-dehydrorhamnose reductase
MKVLVTGANGMLGQDLCPLLEDEGYEVIEADINDFDICDFKETSEFITKENPEYIIHCAAYTNVDKAEEELDVARKVNAQGTENIAKIASEIDATLVYVSTDYVFDGTKTTPYLPTDTPNPINNYGLTKLEGEIAVQKYCKKYYIARTSWLYGIYGKNFVETMLANKDKELKVVHDQTGCPTWTIELANGICELLEGAEYGIYHICGSGKTTWHDFAEEVFHLSNINANLTPCLTADFPRPAKRPAYSVMENDKICRNWKVALKDYLALRDGEV